MKKTLIYFLLIALTVWGLSSCAKADSEFLHTDNTITSIWITPADNTSHIIYGDIDYPEEGIITFTVSRADRVYFDITTVKVRAVVGYDVQITPSLSGIKDLSVDYPITVTATMTGESREYILRAEYSSK